MSPKVENGGNIPDRQNSFKSSYIQTMSILLIVGRVLLYLLSCQISEKNPMYHLWLFFRPLVKYRGSFDLCTVIFLIVSIYVFWKNKDDKKLAFSVLLNFLNTICCWPYILDFWQWLKTSERYLLYVIIALSLLLLLWFGVKYRDICKKYGGIFCENVKQYPVYWMVLGLLGMILMLRMAAMAGELFGFHVSRIMDVYHQLRTAGICISGCFVLYLCRQIYTHMKKGSQVPSLLAFIDFILSIWGLTALYDFRDMLSKYLTVQKVVAIIIILAVCGVGYKLYTAIDWKGIKDWISQKSKWIVGGTVIACVLAALCYFSERFDLIPVFEFSEWALRSIQIFLFVMLVLTMILLTTLMVRCIRYIHKSNWLYDKIRELISAFFSKDNCSKLAICIGGLVILAISIAFTIVLVQWGKGIDLLATQENNEISSIGTLLSYLCAAIVLVVFCMLVMTEIVLFITKSVQKIYQNKEQPLHWVLLLISAVLTYASIQFYNKTDLDDWSRLNIAGNVFGVFSIPVILMAWYVIMTGLIGSLWRIIDEQKTKDAIKKEMENLIPMFINSIFAPFYYLVSFLDDMRSAYIETEQLSEEDEEDEQNRE